MNRAAWMALAFRTALGPGDAQRYLEGDEPDPASFPTDVLEAEARDLAALEALGVAVITPRDPEYPERLRSGAGPLVLQVAGRASLLAEEGVSYFGRLRGEEGARFSDAVDAGTRAVVVLSKGLLRANTLLRGLAGPLADGAVALVSAEPPRAAWGPERDRRRDALLAAFQSRT